MRRYTMRRCLVGLCALGFLAVEAGTASAAWDNVFQTTLFRRWRQRQTVHYYPAPTTVVAASPVPAVNPCQQCTTSYVQRCYYQPVTTYQTQTYYEPVTTYQTSYYYEPVTSYRYSCYYDPCTCSYQQVATPVQSYELRAKSCPVQAWVQRCCSVPVTTMVQSCYLQPQTTCCTTTLGAPIPIPAGALPAGSPPVVTPTPGAGAPGAAPPGVTEQRSLSPNPSPSGAYDRLYPPSTNEPPRMPKATWQPQESAPLTGRPSSPPPPPVKLDRIVVGPDQRVEGQVVRSDNTPRPGSDVLFVSTDRQGPPQKVTANSAGRFSVELPAGGWLVYLTNPDGTHSYHSRIDVGGNQPSSITLTSR